jgi:hypothetical protein
MDGKIAGFTGTRRGMTGFQRGQLFGFLDLQGITEFHHGDCLGADADADKIARSLGCHIVIHPPTDPKLRAFCFQEGDTLLAEKPYLIRNMDIVNAVGTMFAAPAEQVEVQRSGTWMTIRYARLAPVTLYILWDR